MPCFVILLVPGGAGISTCASVSYVSRNRLPSRLRYEHPKPNRAHILRMGSDPPSGKSDQFAKPDPPDGSTITQALEVSFRNVWIRLMTSGIGPEYNDAITAFIVTTMAAFKAGYSINALKFELAANEKLVEYMGRDVTLNDQEKHTRLIWISLVYLTLSKCNFPSDRPIPPVRNDVKGSKLDDIISGLTALVDSIVQAERRGYSLDTFKMELTMQKDIGEMEDLSQAQSNIRSQWSRIVFATLAVLPENLKR